MFHTLIQDVLLFDNKEDYYINLSSLPSLPSDTRRDLLVSVIKNDYNYIKSFNPLFKEPDYSLNNKELEIERVKQNLEISNINETYAKIRKTKQN